MPSTKEWLQKIRRMQAMQQAVQGPCNLRLSCALEPHVSGVARCFQEDPRYSNYAVGELSFSQGGCAVCTIADIVQAEPTDILSWLNEHNFISPQKGTAWVGIPQALRHFGGDGELLSKSGIYDQPNHPMFLRFKDHLMAGNPGIINFRPGYWTRTGHMVAAVGFDVSRDAVLLYDPRDSGRRDGWYPWNLVAAQAQTCILAWTPQTK